MMNIDLHTHGKLSKKSTFSPEYFAEMMFEAKANGLQAVALTEHFNTSNFFAMYDALDQTYPYNGHYYDVNGLKLFPGMEVDIAETGHILLIGLKENVLAVRALLDEHTQEGNSYLLSSCLIWPMNIIFGKSEPIPSELLHLYINWIRHCFSD